MEVGLMDLLRVRTGACDLCGYCCSGTRMTISGKIPVPDPAHPPVREESDDFGTVGDCIYLLRLQGRAVCSLHGTGLKPKICKEWPYGPEDIERTPCAFSFVTLLK